MNAFADCVTYFEENTLIDISKDIDWIKYLHILPLVSKKWNILVKKSPFAITQIGVTMHGKSAKYLISGHSDDVRGPFCYTISKSTKRFIYKECNIPKGKVYSKCSIYKSIVPFTFSCSSCGTSLIREGEFKPTFPKRKLKI